MEQSNGKARLTSILMAFIILFTTIFSNINVSNKVFANDISNTNVVTDFTVSTTNIKDGGRLNAIVKFEGNKSGTSKNIKNGDTINVSWTHSNDLYLDGYVKDLTLSDKGKNIARVSITKNGAVLTFLPDVDKLDDIKGEFYFELEGRNLANTFEENTRSVRMTVGSKVKDISITKDKSGTTSKFYYKTGTIDPSNPSNVNWWISANLTKSDLGNHIWITDTFKEGYSLNEDSFSITIEGYNPKHYNSREDFNKDKENNGSSSISVTNDGLSIFLDKDKFRLRSFRLYFNTKIINNVQKSFTNTSKITYQILNEEQKTLSNNSDTDFTVQNINAGGYAEGTVKGQLVIEKIEKESMKAIQGVKFSLKNNKGYDKILETNSDGKIDEKNLPVGDYTLKEISAPDWIDFDPEKVEEIKFSVLESDTLGHKFVIENSAKKVDKTEVEVEKRWIGPELDEVKFQLKANGNPLANKILTLKKGNWFGKFEDLDKYKDGKEIDYDVEEVNLPSTHSQKKKEKVKNKFIFTNKNVEKVAIPVEKKWIGKKLDSVRVRLFANGNEISYKDLNKENDWKWNFEYRDKYDAEGKEIVYTVREDKVKGYTTEITGNAKDGFVITNKNVEKVAIPVEKKWVGKELDSVRVRLFANGDEISYKDLNKKNDWKWNFEYRDKYDAEGKEIVYTVREDKVKGYTTEITGNAKDGFVIVNKEIKPWMPMTPPTRDLRVVKHWKSSDGNILNVSIEKIEVELYRDGESTGQKLELNALNNWMGEFKDLPVSKTLLGKIHEYTVKEVGESKNIIKFDDNIYKVSYEGDMKDGFVIINQKEIERIPPTEPKKDVYTGRDTTSIDGKVVKPGQELTYSITYKNTTGEEQEVTITDSIPKYTTYVANSADNDGVEKDGVITWTKKLEKDKEFTVTFKVKVNKEVAGKVIKNKAKVKDGKNDYITNEVINPTSNKEIPPTPPTIEKPKRNTPKTAIGSSILASVAMVVISGGLLQVSRKRRNG